MRNETINKTESEQTIKSFWARVLFKTLLFCGSVFLASTTAIVTFQLGESLTEKFLHDSAFIGGIICALSLFFVIDFGNLSLLVDSISGMKSYKWKFKSNGNKMHKQIIMMFCIATLRLITTTGVSYVAMPILSELRIEKANDKYYQDQAKDEKGERKAEIAMTKKAYEDAKANEKSRVKNETKLAKAQKKQIIASGFPWQIACYKRGEIGYMRSSKSERRDRDYALKIDNATSKIKNVESIEKAKTQDLFLIYKNTLSSKDRSNSIAQLEQAAINERTSYVKRLGQGTNILWIIDFVIAFFSLLLAFGVSTIEDANDFEKSKKSFGYAFYKVCVKKYDKAVWKFEKMTGEDFNGDGYIGNPEHKDVAPHLQTVSDSPPYTAQDIEAITAMTVKREIEKSKAPTPSDGTVHAEKEQEQKTEQKREQKQEREQYREQEHNNREQMDLLQAKLDKMEREQKAQTRVEQETQPIESKTVHTKQEQEQDLENITDIRHLKRRCRQTYVRGQREVMEAKEPHKKHKDRTLIDNLNRHKVIKSRLEKIGWNVVYTGKGKEKNIVFEQQY